MHHGFWEHKMHNENARRQYTEELNSMTTLSYDGREHSVSDSGIRVSNQIFTNPRKDQNLRCSFY